MKSNFTKPAVSAPISHFESTAERRTARSGARTERRSAVEPGAEGASPRTVKRGESLHGVGAIVDWLRFTFLPLGSFQEATEHVFRCMQLWFSIPISMKPSKRGIHGYSASSDVLAFVDGEFVRIAIVAQGGENVGGTICIDLSGTGCSVVTDWEAVYATMQDVDARITRCDLALDLMHGEVTIEDINAMYFAGEFNSGGRIPKRYAHESGDIHSQFAGGRTVEIGRRTNGKMLRAYEKGRQLGNPDSQWLRLEVELGSRDRVIPHDVVLKRNEYFCGAHKALAQFLNAAAEKIRTLQKQHESTLEKSTEHLRTQWGKMIHQLCIQHGEDLAAMVADIRVVGVPAKLQRSALARHVYGSHVPEHSIRS